MSWVQCFCSYAAVTCTLHPEKTRELWVYTALMVSEARRCGGKGWSQQVAASEGADFAKLNQSLYATTFLGARAGSVHAVC